MCGMARGRERIAGIDVGWVTVTANDTSGIHWAQLSGGTDEVQVAKKILGDEDKNPDRCRSDRHNARIERLRANLIIVLLTRKRRQDRRTPQRAGAACCAATTEADVAAKDSQEWLSSFLEGVAQGELDQARRAYR